jgi:hypothetical protein
MGCGLWAPGRDYIKSPAIVLPGFLSGKSKSGKM